VGGVINDCTRDKKKEEKKIELSKKNGKESTGFVLLRHSSFLFEEDET